MDPNLVNMKIVSLWRCLYVLSNTKQRLKLNCNTETEFKKGLAYKKGSFLKGSYLLLLKGKYYRGWLEHKHAAEIFEYSVELFKLSAKLYSECFKISATYFKTKTRPSILLKRDFGV